MRVLTDDGVEVIILPDCAKCTASEIHASWNAKNAVQERCANGGKTMSKEFIFFDTVRKHGRVGIDPKFVEAIAETDDGVIIGLNSGVSAVVKGSMKSVADTLEGIYDHEWDYSDLCGERKDDE